MTTKKRAKPEHLQKLTALFEQYPDGLNMRQIQTELQTSPVNAQAALDELGAVKAGAKWVLPDDEVVEPEQVAPGAKADTAVVNENFTTELSGNSGELPKAFDQSVFVGLPSSAKWATVNIDGTGEAWAGVPDRLADGTWDAYGQCFPLGSGFDGSKWRDSIIQREPVASADTVNPVSEQKQNDVACPVCHNATDVAPLGDGECQMCYEDASDKAWWSEVSDYSLIFENIMARVLSTIKKHDGATADRVRELTGMHPDDIADAIQYMVDHGQLVGRSVYFATVYEVAA